MQCHSFTWVCTGAGGCGAGIWVRPGPNTCICIPAFPRVIPPTELITPDFGGTCAENQKEGLNTDITHQSTHFEINHRACLSRNWLCDVICTCAGWVRLAGVTVWFTIAPAGPWAPENTCKSLDAKTRGNKSLQKGKYFEVCSWSCIISGKLCPTCSRSFDEHRLRLQHWGKLSRCTGADWWCNHHFINRHILLGAELTAGLRLRLSRLLGLQQDVLLDLKTHQDSFLTRVVQRDSGWTSLVF